MKTIKCVALFLVILLISCEKKYSTAPVESDFSDLFQRWTNSFEEQIDSVQVYRPGNSRQFPPARFREVFVFANDSSCQYLVLAPSDRHYMQSGRWRIVSRKKRVLAILDSSQTVYCTFQIVELNRELLRFVYIKFPSQATGLR